MWIINSGMYRLGTAKFNNGYERSLYRVPNVSGEEFGVDDEFIQRETWPENIDEEDGHITYAHSFQSKISYNNAFSYCLEFFKRPPFTCYFDSFNQR